MQCKLEILAEKEYITMQKRKAITTIYSNEYNTSMYSKHIVKTFEFEYLQINNKVDAEFFQTLIEKLRSKYIVEGNKLYDKKIYLQLLTCIPDIEVCHIVNIPQPFIELLEQEFNIAVTWENITTHPYDSGIYNVEKAVRIIDNNIKLERLLKEEQAVQKAKDFLEELF